VKSAIKVCNSETSEEKYAQIPPYKHSHYDWNGRMDTTYAEKSCLESPTTHVHSCTAKDA
jgi:hypothetical protein